MKDQKYKILVLSDLKNTSDSILKSTVSLSQMVDADIEFFHVKKPVDIVKRESQLSAMRDINQEHILLDKKLQNLVETVSKEYEVKIKYNFTFGNVKSEIDKYIKASKPDIIVLGKKKSSFKLAGDNLTGFILKNYNGSVMIVSENNSLAPNEELSLGVLNNSEQSINMKLTEHLLNNTSKPLKNFKINGTLSDSEEKSTTLNQNTIDYVFEKGDNTIKNISKFLSKSNVNLLCLNRGEKVVNNKSVSLSSEIKNVINKVDVSLLIN